MKFTLKIKQLILLVLSLGMTWIAWTATIDVLFVYDQSAQDWLTSNGMSTSGLTASSVEKLNRVMLNSGIASAGDFRAVGEMLVPSSSTGDVVSMLTTVVCDSYGNAYVRDGYDWNLVHRYRESIGADVVCVFTRVTSGASGIGWEFSSMWTAAYVEQYSNNAYCIVSVEAAAPDEGYVVPHEICHLLGAGHADRETYGDGNGTDGPCRDPYSAAYYLTTPNGNYTTLMAYTPRPGSSEHWQTIPYLSNPDVEFDGVPTGDAGHNNAKTVRDNFATIAAFRNTVVPEPTPGPEPTPSYEVLGFTPEGAFQPVKAVNAQGPYVGAIYDQATNVVGIIQLKIGKMNARKRVSKVSGTVIRLDGKKYGMKAVEIPTAHSVQTRADLLVSKTGYLSLAIGANGFTGSMKTTDGEVWNFRTTDLSPGFSGAAAKFHMETVEDLAGISVLGDCQPAGTDIRVVGGKWQTAKATTVKYVKGAQGYELLLDEGRNGSKTNRCGLKLTYAAKTSTFKGSFTLYCDVGTAVKPKLRKFKAMVTGVVVDGKGVGMATQKATAQSWPVVVE